MKNSHQFSVLSQQLRKYAYGFGMGIFLILIFCLGAWVQPVFAQDQELNLLVSKSIGYASGSDLRGAMVMLASGPDNLQSVVFMIDGKVIGEAKAAPFLVNFNTTDYPTGPHDLSAQGKTADGRTVSSAVRHFRFVTATEEGAGIQRVIFPLLGILGLVMVVMLAVQFLAFRPSRRKHIPLGTPRTYGFSGGAICPKCGRPFPIHWWGFNAIGGKLDICEHCGRWSRVTRRSMDELRRAEAAELKMAQPETPIAAATAEDQLRQQIDDSKFSD